MHQRFVMDLTSRNGLTFGSVERALEAINTQAYWPVTVRLRDVTGQNPALMTREDFVKRIALTFGLDADKQMRFNPDADTLAVRAISQGVAERETVRVTEELTDKIEALKTKLAKVEERKNYYQGEWQWLCNHATWRQRWAFIGTGYSSEYDEYYQTKGGK